MAESQLPLFKLDQVPKAKQQIKELAVRAGQLGLKKDLAKALKDIVYNLRNRPMLWGESKYRAKLPGGMVFQGVHALLVVSYVAYETEKVVCLLDIRPLPNTPLES